MSTTCFDTAGAIIDQVDYAEGGIVSRPVVKHEGGKVILFAFDEGQALSEHTAPFDALLNVVEGRAEVTIAGQVHSLQAGQAVMMPADIPHAVNALGRFKMMLVMIRPS